MRPGTSTVVSAANGRLSTRSTRRSSDCAARSGSGSAMQPSPLLSRTTSTRPGAGHASACAALPHGSSAARCTHGSLRRGDPHRNIASLPFRYDTTLGFPDAVGFRAGIARPFRPWDFATDAPADILEIPLAAMDATLAEERYLGLSAKRAEPRLTALLDWAASNGGAFAILWHPDRFDPLSSGGWDRLYSRVLDGVQARGGDCVSAGELSSHST